MIPRRLHFTWLGPNPMPPKYAEYIEGWRKLHPDWHVKVWGDEQAAKLYIRNKVLYDSTDNYVLRSDILRHEILFDAGGIYMDCDVEPVKPLDPLTLLNAFACDQGRGLVGSAVLGTIAHNPVWRTIIDGLPAAVARGGDLGTMVGPGYITPILLRHRVTVLTQDRFYPYLWDEPEKPPTVNTIGIHRWAGGWL